MMIKEIYNQRAGMRLPDEGRPVRGTADSRQVFLPEHVGI